MYPATGGGPGPLTVITQSPLQIGLIDRAYSQSLVASGGNPPYPWSLTADSGPLPIKYPIRFSAGIQDESFFNFSGPHSQQLRPYVQISVF